MTDKKRTYLCIDLKSFYASVECAYRKLDPLKTNLVVADVSRTEKTICLAVSPSLKEYGMNGRCRLFEVIQKVKEINDIRKKNAPNHTFLGSSIDKETLFRNPSLSLDFVIAKPRMQEYINVSSFIYSIYLKYVSKEDIHVYSIDEVFMDVTSYLSIKNIDGQQLARQILADIHKQTNITATCGIGDNLYLAKVAMDILAKHMTPDENGARIAYLDEKRYKEKLWNHTPLTDFWRIGKGIENKLNALQIFTMGDIARCAFNQDDDFHTEDLLFDEFGVNAELLIDHAFGKESVTIKDIKEYKPESNSISVGQVLHCAYNHQKAKTILHEMAEEISLDLVKQNHITDQISLYIGYDNQNITFYEGEVKLDRYNRKTPKPYLGRQKLPFYTNSLNQIKKAIFALFDKEVNSSLSIRRINITALNVIDEKDVPSKKEEQLSLFIDYDEQQQKDRKLQIEMEKENQLSRTLLSIKEKFGKNSVLKMNDLEEEATAKERNNQIGGHKA